MEPLRSSHIVLLKKVTFVSLTLMLAMMVFINSVSSASNLKKWLNIGNSSYYGEVKNGRPHGKGTMKWDDGTTYSGDWINGMRSGTGTLKVKSLLIEGSIDTHSGGWKNDKKNGYGLSTTNMLTGSEVVSCIFKDDKYLYGSIMSSYKNYIHFSNLTKNSDITNFIFYDTEEAENYINSGGKVGQLAYLLSLKKEKMGMYTGIEYNYITDFGFAGWSEGIYTAELIYGALHYAPYKTNGYYLDHTLGLVTKSNYFEGKEKTLQLKLGQPESDFEVFFNTFNKKLNEKKILTKPFHSDISKLYKILPNTEWN